MGGHRASRAPPLKPRLPARPPKGERAGSQEGLGGVQCVREHSAGTPRRGGGRRGGMAAESGELPRHRPPPARLSAPQTHSAGQVGEHSGKEEGGGGGGRAQRGARGARGRGRGWGGGRRQRGESQRHHPPRLRIGGFAKTTGGRLRKRPDSPVVMPSTGEEESREAQSNRGADADTRLVCGEKKRVLFFSRCCA